MPVPASGQSSSGPLSQGNSLPSPRAKGFSLRKTLIFGVPLLALLGLVGMRVVAVRAKNADLQKQAASRRGAAPAVEIATAGPKTILNTLSVVGDAESPNVARLAPKVSGPITELQVREGDQVTRGQVLVRIDPREVEAGVTTAQANVAEAQARLAQAQTTAQATLVGIEGTITGGQAGVSTAQASLNQAQRNQAAQIAAAQASVGQLTSQISAANADVRSPLADVTAAEANLNNARIRYQRTAELYKGGYIAAQDVDDAKAVVQVQEGALAVAQAAVKSRRDAAAALIEQRKAAQAQVTIVRRQAEASIATANAAIKSARATLQTATANRAQGPAYQQNLAALQAAVSSATAALNAAQTRRSDAELRSPIDGTVTARDGDPGSLAQPGTPVVTVQALSPLFVEAAIPVEIGGSIRRGAGAKLVFDALPGRTIEGRVEGVNQAADPQNRRFTVRVAFDNADGAVRPGMFARVTLVTKRTQASVAIPLDALNEERGKTTVTVIDKENKAEVRDVEVGARDGDNAEITKGIQPGDRVVILSYTPVRDGGKVTIGKPEERRPESGGRESESNRQPSAPIRESRPPNSSPTGAPR